MSLPQTLSPASPADLDNPSQGASQIRGIKNYLIDVFGAPNNSAVSAAPMSFTTAGVMSILQSPLTVPSLLQGGASQVLRIESQYSNLVFGINGASVMSLNTTGMLMQTGFKEWPSGITGFLGTQGNSPLTLRTNAANRLTVAAGGNVGIGTAIPTALLHVAGTVYSSTVDANVLSVQGVGPHAIGGAAVSNNQLRLTGAFSDASTMANLQVEPTNSPPAGVTAYGINVASIFVEASSGTHNELFGMRTAPTFTAGAAATTDLGGLIVGAITAPSGTVNASSIKITAAPSGATNNYGLWVAGGIVRFDGGLGFSVASPSTTNGPFFSSTSSVFTHTCATSQFQWNNQTGGAELMRLTNAGILLLGTTVTTSSSAGELVLANSKSLRAINAAGTSGLALLALDSSNNVNLGSASTVDTITSGSGRVYLGGTTPFLEYSTEIGDPAAPSANGARLYIKDDGSGNTQLAVRFNTGAVNIIATQGTAGSPFASEFVSSAQTVTLGSALSVAHGLGAVPKLVQLTMRNVTGEGGYSTNDELVVSGVLSEQNASNTGVNIAFDVTNVVVMTDAAGFTAKRKDTGANFGVTAGNWKYVVRAWK